MAWAGFLNCAAQLDHEIIQSFQLLGNILDMCAQLWIERGRGTCVGRTHCFERDGDECIDESLQGFKFDRPPTVCRFIRGAPKRSRDV
jgi:hypothetical protein